MHTVAIFLNKDYSDTILIYAFSAIMKLRMSSACRGRGMVLVL